MDKWTWRDRLAERLRHLASQLDHHHTITMPQDHDVVQIVMEGGGAGGGGADGKPGSITIITRKD